MARVADPKSLRQLVRYHVLQVGLLAPAKEVVAALENDRNNEYIGLGAVQVQIAQARKSILEELGVAVPDGRGRMSNADRDRIAQEIRGAKVRNKLQGMKKRLANQYRKLSKEAVAA